MTRDEIILANPSDADAAAIINALPPVPRPSSLQSTYVTYVSIGVLFDNYNLASAMADALTAWFDLPDLSQVHERLPSPGVLRLQHARLAGYPGLDLSAPGTPVMLALFAGTPNLGRPLILTPEQAATLLSIGYVVAEPVTAEWVAARRAELIRRSSADTATAASYTAYTLAQAINERHVSDGDVEPVTLAAPTVPAGFAFVAGRLVQVEGD